jgi:choline-sulfatase
MRARSNKLPRLGFVVLFAALVLPGCSRKTTYHDAPVILISIDTLRADHLPAYGYTAVETPHIDAFRRDSVLFSNAYSQVPLTLPSHVSILSGLLPPENHVRNNLGYIFDPDKYPSLPRMLKAHGYATGAAVSSFVLRAETGLAKAFDFYDDKIPIGSDAESFVHDQRLGGDTARIAIPWIESKKDGPFFFFFHIYEPHTPYDPPEPFKSRYENPYDGEIASADAIIGDFLDHLKKDGIYDRAIIVLLSDHGEGLMDHGEDQHGILLYREAIHVPLMIKLPKSVRAGETIADASSLADVTPSLLRLLGIAPPAQLDRPSLLAKEKASGAPVYSETYFPMVNLGWSALRSMTSRQFQYIDAPRPELYDVASDPKERANVIDSQRRAAASMRSALAPFPVVLEPITEVDPEAAAKLTALGYIGSAQTRETAANLPNPMDEISKLPRIKEAFQLAEQHRTREAVAALRALLAENPRMLDLWEKLGEVLDDAGAYDAAIAAYQDGIRRNPEFSSGLALSLGFVYLKSGKLDEAAQYAEVGMRMNPPKAHELLALVAASRGRFDEAMNEARLAAGPRPDMPGALMLVAEIEAKQGRFAEALATLDRAGQRSTEIHQGKVSRLDFVRGDVLARLDRAQEAEVAYRREIANFPSDLQAYANLAVLYFVEQKGGAVDAILSEMTAKNPTPGGYGLAARTYDAFENAPKAAEMRRRAAAARV